MDKYYHILGLQPGADKAEIKRAYRQLAMKYHPDINPGPLAREKFMEILEAYEYLSGIRKKTAGPREFTAEELQKIKELMVKAAQEKARKKYRARLRQIKLEKEKAQAREYTIAIYLLIALVLLGTSTYYAYNLYIDLTIDSDPAFAVMEIEEVGQKRIKYIFQADSNLVRELASVSNDGLVMLSDEGLPLEIGDQYEVKFYRKDPTIHRINFAKMSPATLNRHFSLATEVLRREYKETGPADETELRRRTDCLSLLVFQEYGPAGLAHIIFSGSFILENPGHNSLRWFFMKRSDRYQALENNCRLSTE